MGIGRPDALFSSPNQMGAVRPDATSLALILPVDTRSQGVPQSETGQRDDRQKLISTIGRAILSDPDKNNMIQELQESRYNEDTPLARKQMKKFIHNGTLNALSCTHCRIIYNASIVCATLHWENVLSVGRLARRNTLARKCWKEVSTSTSSGLAC